MGMTTCINLLQPLIDPDYFVIYPWYFNNWMHQVNNQSITLYVYVILSVYVARMVKCSKQSAGSCVSEQWWHLGTTDQVYV